MSVDAFISQFGSVTEAYYFYNNEVELHFDTKAHQYLLAKDGDLLPVDGCTNVCHIIDKSEALIPWACKQQAAYLLNHAGVTLPDGNRILRGMSWEEFESLVLASKNAHKERLEEAGNIGHVAHAWIEKYIKAILAHGQDSAQVQEILAKMPEEGRAANCCVAALGWMQSHNVRWLGTERKVYSRMYNYAGTMDGLCIVDSCSNKYCCKSFFRDRLTISDWKTSNYLYVEYLYQTAAYMNSFNEENNYLYSATKDETFRNNATDRWIIRLGKDDAEFETWYAPPEDFVGDFNTFLLALDLKRSHETTQKRIQTRLSETRESIRADRRAAKEAAAKEEKARKAAARELAKQDKLEALRLTCKNATKYKGIRKPTCNDGAGCVACIAKYSEVQSSKVVPTGARFTAKRDKKVKPCDSEHGAPACDNYNCWHREPTPGCEVFTRLCLPSPKAALMLSAPQVFALGTESDIAAMATRQ